MKIFPPFYLFFSSEPCWKCGEEQTVVALGVSGCHDEEYGFCSGGEGQSEEIILLVSNLSEIPEGLRSEIAKRHPRFKLHHSHTASSSYYANMCGCGAHFGDFYLFSEPGGAFFPTSEEEAESVAYCELPIAEPLEVVGNWSEGPGDNLFKNGRRVDA